MTNFPSRDLATATEETKPLLELSQAAFGRLPGLHKVMSDNPKVLHKLFNQTDLYANEMTVVWQTINMKTNVITAF